MKTNVWWLILHDKFCMTMCDLRCCFYSIYLNIPFILPICSTEDCVTFLVLGIRPWWMLWRAQALASQSCCSIPWLGSLGPTSNGPNKQILTCGVIAPGYLLPFPMTTTITPDKKECKLLRFYTTSLILQSWLHVAGASFFKTPKHIIVFSLVSH